MWPAQLEEGAGVVVAFAVVDAAQTTSLPICIWPWQASVPFLQTPHQPLSPLPPSLPVTSGHGTVVFDGAIAVSVHFTVQLLPAPTAPSVHIAPVPA